MSKSPQKSLAIKGPPKVINEKLDIDNYQGVKVMDINVRPLNQSVAQIRAQKEMSSIASQQKLGTTSIGEIGSSGLNHMGMAGASQSNSQYVAGMTSGPGGQTNPADASRILSAETINDKQQKKTITDILQDMITNKSAKDTNNEMSQLRIENDMVTTFFDNVTKLSDHFTFSFVEDLKKDVSLNLNNPLDRPDHSDSLSECQRACSLLHLLVDALKKAPASLRQFCEHSDLLQDSSQEDQ